MNDIDDLTDHLNSISLKQTLFTLRIKGSISNQEWDYNIDFKNIDVARPFLNSIDIRTSYVQELIDKFLETRQAYSEVLHHSWAPYTEFLVSIHLK